MMNPFSFTLNIGSNIRNRSTVQHRIQYSFNSKSVQFKLIHCWRVECKSVRDDLSQKFEENVK